MIIGRIRIGYQELNVQTELEEADISKAESRKESGFEWYSQPNTTDLEAGWEKRSFALEYS